MSDIIVSGVNYIEKNMWDKIHMILRMTLPVRRAVWRKVSDIQKIPDLH